MSRRNQPLITGPPWLCKLFSWFPILRPDLLELFMPIEKAFGVKLRTEDFPWNYLARESIDFTAGELHDWVCSQMTASTKPIPPSSWHRIQRLLSYYTGVPVRLVRRGSYVQRDLHFFEGA